MLDHILIAYDGSGSADRALEAGGRIARGLGARVTLFHGRLQGPIPEAVQAYAEADPGKGGAHSVAGFCEAASLHPRELNRIGDRLVKRARSVLEAYGLDDVVTVTRTGDPATDILEYAAANGVDTLVVGTRGYGRIDELALGSVSHKLQHAFRGCVMTVH